MFKQFTAINNTPLFIKEESITLVGTDAAGNTFIAQNGEVVGISVKETPEEVIKIIKL